MKAGGHDGDEKKERYSRIVLSAAELFIERGAENVRMTDIAEASGIGVASLYRYFGTKSAIMLASGTLLWHDVATLFETRFHSKDYARATGFGQMKILLNAYVELYAQQQPFLRFLAALDEVILAEKPSPETLREYSESMLDFYDLFRMAHEKGVADGSIRSGLDCRFLYRTFTDFMNGAARKFIRGEVLPVDDYSQGEAELKFFVQMALGYLHAPET